MGGGVVFLAELMEKISLSSNYAYPVWKIWEEFETFLENKLISKMRKKHLGDQTVINS